MIPPCISHPKDANLAGPLDGDLPPGCKPAIETRLSDRATPMTPPMSPTSKRSSSSPNNGWNSSNSLLMQLTTFLSLPSASKTTMMVVESLPVPVTPPMSPALDELQPKPRNPARLWLLHHECGLRCFMGLIWRDWKTRSVKSPGPPAKLNTRISLRWKNKDNNVIPI